MLTLQHDISYEGNVDTAPVQTVTVTVLFPTFSYIQENDSITRTAIKPLVVEIDHTLTNTDYVINIPVSTLTGTTPESFSDFLKYMYNTSYHSDSPLDNLRLDIPIQFASDSLVLNTTSIRVIYWLRQYSKNWQLLKDPTLENFTDINDFFERNLFLINSDVYDDLVKNLAHNNDLDSPLALLRVIETVFDLPGYDRSSTFSPTQDQHKAAQEILVKQEVIPEKAVGPALDVLEKYLPSLFNFPLNIPTISTATLEVAGTFQINTDGAVVTRRDLQRYAISFEYGYLDANKTLTAKRVSYDWSTGPNPQDNEPIPFAFLPIASNAVRGKVIVNVKAFDGSVLWHRSFSPSDPELQALKIVVDLVRPTYLERPKTAQKAQLKRLRGQTLQFKDECPLKDLTVVVEAKDTLEGSWRVVAAGTTDTSGSFSMPYPYGIFVAAQARVSLSPQTPAEIPIRINGNENETIADDFLYLLVTDPICSEDTGVKAPCDCDAPVTAPRLPDQSDLITSDQYTQDIGGACVNLSTPNRTLSEYSYQAIVRTSDPDVANYELKKNKKGGFDLEKNNKGITRGSVTLDNPIRWQDIPGDRENLSMYQAVTVATGHVLYYKAEFKADGYSLGDLLYSLGLAPGQKKQVVVIDSAHQLQGAEDQRITQDEDLAADLFSERDITDQVAGNLNEASRGRSSSDTSGISAGLGLGAVGDFFSGVLGVSGGAASADSSASQNSSRSTSASFGEKLRQKLTQNAQSYRQLNATVVTTVKEGQQYSVNTEVVANHNHCHALTMMYFEVLRHFAIYQELVNVEECIFVPLLMTDFRQENIYKWRDVLASHLLPIPSNTYIKSFSSSRLRLAGPRGRVKHPLISAFDANERIQTNYEFVDFPESRYCDEPIISVTGSLTLRVNIPRPKTIYDRILSFPIVTRKQVKNRNNGGIWGGLVNLFVGPDLEKKTWEEKVKIIDEHIIIYDNFQRAHPADVIEVIKFDDLFDNNPRDGAVWSAIATLCGRGNDLIGFMRTYFSHKTISQWDQTFNEEIAPIVFQALINQSISILPFGQIEVTPASRYNGGQRIMRLNITQLETSLTRSDIESLGIMYENSLLESSGGRGIWGAFADLFPQASASRFWQAVTFTLSTLSVRYTTAQYEGQIINKSVQNDLYDNGTANPFSIQSPMNRDEQKNPKKEDKYLVLSLLEHLNSNIEYYNKVLWHRLDPDRRYMLLDGFTIPVFNSAGVPLPAPRSLASVVKNELLTVTGNSLVFPVAAGYRVSQSYILEKHENEEAEISLLDHYQPLTPVPPYRLSVPSSGVFLEAVQGACDACEKIKPNSSQDWTKFTTDEPTSVLPVTTPVPTITDWKAAFEDLATPMINIQNAPAAPSPGTGLTSVQELLGKSDVFKDITGLEGTQQNVLKTYLSNQENAKAFGEMAKDMAMQQHNTDNSDKIMDSLNAARNSGALSNEDYGKLVKNHHEQIVDGGESKRAESQPQKTTQKPTLVDAAIRATDAGKNVKATSSDADGNTASLDVRGDGSDDQVLAKIPGILSKIKQPNPMACWATAATIMVSWKNQASYTVEQVMAMAGQIYLDKLNNGEGLLSSEKDAFLTTLKLIGEPPANFPPQQYIDWIKEYGPLWITTDASVPTDSFSPHARILFRIEGTNTDDGSGMRFVFVNPATGAESSESFAEFIASFEAMVTDNPGNLFIQIVHFSDSIKETDKEGDKESGEGYSIEGPWNIGEPIHEKLALAALHFSEVEGDFTKKIGSDPKTNEFLRGVIWNDDPALLLFDDKKYNNWDFSSGYEWWSKFRSAKSASTRELRKNITGRSHYGDMQFLHAMASKKGEDPDFTRGQILLWVECMYELAVGIRKGTDKLDILGTLFTNNTDPNKDVNFKNLLTRDTEYVNLDLQRRAIGSVLHIIQDSYAKGHTRRKIKRFSDLGEIENFHCYKGQDSDRHKHYDTFDASKLDVSKLYTFNGIIGARNAIECSIEVLNLWNVGKAYSDGPKALFEERIFKLSENAKPSNTTVDQEPGND